MAGEWARGLSREGELLRHRIEPAAHVPVRRDVAIEEIGRPEESLAARPGLLQSAFDLRWRARHQGVVTLDGSDVFDGGRRLDTRMG
jgi:hypothetical protein